MAIDHLSLYQLTIEKGTAFSARYEKGGLTGLPVEDLAADMYDATNELCERAGLFGYEVSNYAKPGAESRHNLIYWRYGDYLGIGPGAHGRLTVDGTKYATEHYKMPNAWLENSERGKGEKIRDGLSNTDQANEYLIMGLRITEGMDRTRLENLAGAPVDQCTLDHLNDLNLITQDGANSAHHSARALAFEFCDRRIGLLADAKNAANLVKLIQGRILDAHLTGLSTCLVVHRNCQSQSRREITFERLSVCILLFPTTFSAR